MKLYVRKSHLVLSQICAVPIPGRLLFWRRVVQFKKIPHYDTLVSISLFFRQTSVSSVTLKAFSFRKTLERILLPCENTSFFYPLGELPTISYTVALQGRKIINTSKIRTFLSRLSFRSSWSREAFWTKWCRSLSRFTNLSFGTFNTVRPSLTLISLGSWTKNIFISVKQKLYIE